MARRAARRALEPAMAGALEGLGFSRAWPVFIVRRSFFWAPTLSPSGHDLVDGLGLYGEPTSIGLSGGLGDLKQWPFASEGIWGDRSFELDSVRVVRDASVLMAPHGDAHAFVMEGRVVPEACAIRVLVSSKGFDSALDLDPGDRAPIYTQIEWGDPEADESRLWSYSLKGV